MKKLSKTKKDFLDNNGWSSSKFFPVAKEVIEHIETVGLKISFGRTVIIVGDRLKFYVHKDGRSRDQMTVTDMKGKELRTYTSDEFTMKAAVELLQQHFSDKFYSMKSDSIPFYGMKTALSKLTEGKIQKPDGGFMTNDFGPRGLDEYHNEYWALRKLTLKGTEKETWIVVQRLTEMECKIIRCEKGHEDLWSKAKMETKFVHLFEGKDVIFTFGSIGAIFTLVKFEEITPDEKIGSEVFAENHLAQFAGRDIESYAIKHTEPITPEPGMGATMQVGSDRYPYTIHKVDGKSIWVTQDNFERTDKNDHTASQQEYKFSNSNEKRPEKWVEYTLRRNGKYARRGESQKHMTLTVGFRNAYQDPSF